MFGSIKKIPQFILKTENNSLYSANVKKYKRCHGRTKMEFPLFEKFPKLQYGLSEKKDGSMRLFNDFSKDQTILKNREIYFSQPGISLDRLVSADLVHGNNIQMVNKNQAGKIISNTDAIVTNTENLFLTITVADCFPVYFYEPVSKVVALAHIGWRGA